VKQTPRLAHIPVVLLTGAFEPVDQVKAAAVGCDGVLAKPFEPQLVIARVKELLGRPGRPAVPLDAGLAPPPAPATGFWPADPLLTGERPGAGAPKLDDYFDQLDAAFTSLSGRPPADMRTTAAGSSAPAEIDWFGLKPAPAPVEGSDLPLSSAAPLPPFATPVAPAPPVAPPPVQAPVPVVAPVNAVNDVKDVKDVKDAKAVAAVMAVAEAPDVAEVVAPPPPRPSAPAPDLPPRPLPALADAFAAILAAEQGEPAPVAPPAWPTWPSGAGTGPAVPDDLVEQVSRRVLEQLTDRVVRDAVADTVSSIAERLVREEIERIKASIT
jgi:CheY-like chemotaxis protein